MNTTFPCTFPMSLITVVEKMFYFIPRPAGSNSNELLTIMTSGLMSGKGMRLSINLL